jgi:hypothetical protein
MKEDSFVYVLAASSKDDNDKAPVKVGITSNPEVRASAIRTSCPFPVRMQICFGPMTRDNARAVEREAHHAYSRFRAHGEWFNVEPRYIVETVSTIVKLICIGKVDDLTYARLSSKLGVAAADMYMEPA